MVKIKLKHAKIAAKLNHKILAYFGFRIFYSQNIQKNAKNTNKSPERKYFPFITI